MITGNDFFVLGIEGGGTKTTWALLSNDGKVVKEGRGEASNVQHSSDPTLLRIFAAIRRNLSIKPNAIGAAFAGCHLESERQKVARLLLKTWPKAQKIVVDEDTCSAYAGAHGRGEGIIVIAGTGSNVFGIKGDHREKAGGWGNLFADPGSGYDVARRGLVEVYNHYDATHKTTALGKAYLKKTGTRDLEELVPWVLHRSSKTEVASLAPAVFEAARQGDPLAKKVVLEGVEGLARRVVYVSKRLGIKKPQVGLVGSLFEKDENYFQLFLKVLKNEITPGNVFISRTPGAVGAALLVKHALGQE